MTVCESCGQKTRSKSCLWDPDTGEMSPVCRNCGRHEMQFKDYLQEKFPEMPYKEARKEFLGGNWCGV